MKTVEEIKARYWFFKGNRSGLMYARSYANYDFAKEIKETEHQIMMLEWILEDKENDN